jgi:PIN domain nuclease of toxin-antitoxin system
MSVLLDTHAFLWYVLDDPKFTRVARDAIEAGSVNTDDPRALISPVSYWEIAVKISIGKYRLNEPYEVFWRTGIERNGFEVLPVEIRHTATLLNLPFHHKDPFDRLLIAQAISEGMPLVSADEQFDQYPIARVW